VSVIVLIVMTFMRNVIMPSVVMVSVTAPIEVAAQAEKEKIFQPEFFFFMTLKQNALWHDSSTT
jgi:hypothetical protein